MGLRRWLIPALCVLAEGAALVVGGPRMAVRAPSRVPPAVAMAEAATIDETAPRIVSFSERAMQQLQTMKESQQLDVLFLRMGVRAGGCSGMSYVMDLTTKDEVTDDDTIVDLEDGMRCVIDPKSLMYLFGMQLDYSDELIGGGFSFQNPNAEETCGCGKSFGV